MEIVKQGQEYKNKAKEYEDSGNELIRQGQSKIPKFNVTESIFIIKFIIEFREYYEKLYRLACTLQILKQGGVDVNSLVDETEERQLNTEEMEEEIRNLKLQQASIMMLNNKNGFI